MTEVQIYVFWWVFIVFWAAVTGLVFAKTAGMVKKSIFPARGSR